MLLYIDFICKCKQCKRWFISDKYLNNVNYVSIYQAIWYKQCIRTTQCSIMATYKMVRLTPQAYDALTGIGKKNESYSDVVIRLVDHYKKTWEAAATTKKK